MTMTKNQHRSGRRPVRRPRTRLIDLTGPKLYAMIVYRLSMALIVAFTILKMGQQGS